MLTSLLAALAGWGSLARRFRASRRPPGEELRYQVVGVGRVRENGVTVLVVSPEGLYLRAAAFFRPGRPPLLIPWGALSAAESDPPRPWRRPYRELAVDGGGAIGVREKAYGLMRAHAPHLPA